MSFIQDHQNMLYSNISNGNDIKRINKKIDILIKHELENDGSLLRDIDDQTDEMCLTAVMNDGNSLRYVKCQTREICLAAVMNNGLSIKFVKEQTEELCLTAINDCIEAFRYVREEMQTYNVCKAAVLNDASMMQYIKSQSIIEMLIDEYPSFLKYVPGKYRTFQMEKKAVMSCPNQIEYVSENNRYELERLMIEHDPLLIRYTYSSYDICLLALECKDIAIRNIPKEYQTNEVCYYFIKNAKSKNWKNLKRYVHNHSPKVRFMMLLKTIGLWKK
jgi:hypothetical protein